MFLICLFFAPLPFLSAVPSLFPLWISVPPLSSSPIPLPFLKHSTSLCLSLSLFFFSCTPCIAVLPSKFMLVNISADRRRVTLTLCFSLPLSLLVPLFLSLSLFSLSFSLCLSLSDIPPMWSQQAASASVMRLPFSRLQLTSLCVREIKERGNGRKRASEPRNSGS